MYIIVDDERLGAEGVKNALAEIDGSLNPEVFLSSAKALEYAESHDITCAFLDISMPVMNGVELAKKIKYYHPRCNIVFTTGYDNYYGEAFGLGASDYLLKPITAEKVRHALDNLRFNRENLQSNASAADKGIRIQCFGNFEVFFDGQPIHFGRGKAREMLAYLVYRDGAGVTKGEIMANLWEDDNDSYYGVVKKDLVDTLKKLGADDILNVQWKSIAVRKEKVRCDFFDFMTGKPGAVNLFLGEFMNQYSWAEDMEATLCMRQ